MERCGPMAMQRLLHTPAGKLLIRLLVMALMAQEWPMLASAAPVPRAAQVSGCFHDGDVDNSGAATPADALLVFLHLFGIAPSLDDCQQQRANVAEPANSGITPADALCIFRRFLRLPSCLENLSPVADAGVDREVLVGSTVQLDGSRSVSAVPAGSTATLSDPMAALPTFVADVAGTYRVELTIHDGRQASADTVSITATPTLMAPVLAPVGNQTVALGTALTLQLTATDPNGDALTFSAAPLPLPANASLDSFTGRFLFTPTAEQVGDIELTFTVSDGVLTDEETITITVQGPAPGGVTALTGLLLDTNDFVQGRTTPVVGAVVSVLGSGVSTSSDANGRFTLSGIPAGSQILDIATAMANPAPDGAPYASFREEITLIARVTNVVERPFFLPRLAMDSLTPVDPNSTTTVTNPELATTMTVPPNTAMNPDGTPFTGALSISEVPAGMAPAALPPELRSGLLITIQPVGVVFATPVPITFPNIDGLLPGSDADIWSLDPQTGTFVIVGTGRVTADGTRIVTVSGGIRAADWHLALPPGVLGAAECGRACG